MFTEGAVKWGDPDDVFGKFFSPEQCSVMCSVLCSLCDSYVVSSTLLFSVLTMLIPRVCHIHYESSALESCNGAVHMGSDSSFLVLSEMFTQSSTRNSQGLVFFRKLGHIVYVKRNIFNIILAGNKSHRFKND